MMKYASLLASWLREEGYTTCFFVAGGGIMHLLDGFRKEFKCIPVVHEHTAGVAAEHFNQCAAKGSGKAFALVTTGPGLTNVVTAIAGCYVEHRELLVVAGQVKSSDMLTFPERQRGVQEIDGVSLTKSITVAARCLTEPVVKLEFQKLVRKASAPHPGPVLIEVCLDVQGQFVDPDIYNSPSGVPVDTKTPAAEAVMQVANKIRSAKRPLFLIGGLVSRDCMQKNLEKLQRLKIPVATTTSAIDRVPSDSCLYVGRTGTWGGQRAANLIIAQADLVVAIGAQLDLQQTGFNYHNFVPNAKLIKVFPSDAELERAGPSSYLNFNCIPDEFLDMLAETVSWTDIIGWCQYKDTILQNLPAIEPANLKESKFINPFIFLNRLSQACDENDIHALCSSGGTFTGALQTTIIKKGQIATTSAAHASMGYGLATAIGVAFSNPDRRVIATEGEGGFSQNLQELALLKKHQLNIKLFLFDNSGYASIRATQRKFFDGAYLGCDPETGLSFPNWRNLFYAYDIPCDEICLGDDTIENIKNMLSRETGPAAFVVNVDPDQSNWPAVSTQLTEDGKLVSAPLYSMLPEISDALKQKLHKYF